MSKWFSRCWIFIAVLILISCAETTSCSSMESFREISVMNWNLQTFFDGQFDGNEYQEFRNGDCGWNLDKYDVRLERLAGVIKEFDCDVVVMEELEKEGQLYDIANKLSGDFDSGRKYRFAFFAKEGGASIGCGILSRYPLSNITVHELEIRTEDKQPSMRPIIKADVLAGDKKLVLFVNHWKSKSGGAEESEKWRVYQENQLAALMQNELKKGEKNLLACGDFNRDILEFSRLEGGVDKNICLGQSDGLNLYSPWFIEGDNLSGSGSYFYDGEWSRIDNFFVTSKEKIKEYVVGDKGEWTDSQGHPFRYKVYSGSGYSDHLPISCVIKL